MKKFTLGFITALLITCTLSVQAEIKEYILHLVDYKVMVDGDEYYDPQYPTLNYEGTTYVPIKKLGDLLGVSVTWNNELYQAEISQSHNNTVDITTDELFRNKYKAVAVNGYYYLSIYDLVENHDLSWDIDPGIEQFTQVMIIKNSSGTEVAKINISDYEECVFVKQDKIGIYYINVQLLFDIIGYNE